MANPEAERRCSRCYTLYPPHLIGRAFRLDRVRHDASCRTKVVCRPCELTARDRKKRVNRWMVKARDVIRRHAVRLSERWPDIRTPDDLIRIYGWDAERLAHDAEFQYQNGCSYCGEPYQDMGHGLADITLDVQNPESRPHYRMNTKWCCQTCNRKKGALNPDAFESDRQIYELWSEHQARGYDPVTDDPASLFYRGNQPA